MSHFDPYSGDPMIGIRGDANRLKHLMDELPCIPDLDARIAARITDKRQLRMDSWHCGTTHCVAGWAVVVAGLYGNHEYDLTNPGVIAALLYRKAGLKLPDFFADDETAYHDLQARAQEQEIRMAYYESWAEDLTAKAMEKEALEDAFGRELEPA